MTRRRRSDAVPATLIRHYEIDQSGHRRCTAVAALEALGEGWDFMKAAGTVAVDWVANTASQLSAMEAGTDLVAGFVEGIEAGIKNAVANATELGSAATSAPRSVLDEHSPFRVAIESGSSFSASFEAGIEPVDIA